MNREEAKRLIRHHEAAAQRHGPGMKRAQHEEAIRYLRETYSIAPPQIIKAVPMTDFERLQQRLVPSRPSKPDWNNIQRYEK